ncbi:MAG TPA: CBS domain-containing protein [Segeticoccus sp.]|uniref:CBS domain-containing protein n=1 Tax=Segeticoccus sp. TaxID=2706531 RepID=UPI002D7EB7DC|nr:CBS domain-containing protein [Segeticoccus sp.]HET8601120.1 CBS domain-containing protein [Segeticoccus sp.]
MQARDMVEEFPVTSLDADALEAAKVMAAERLPGLVVVDARGRPHSILGASQVVRFLVPRYVQDDPSLAGVVGESLADQVADKLSGVSVRRLLPEEPQELAVVHADDTVLELAAVMARLRSPLVAVVEDDQVVGVVTASRLLQLVTPQ